MSGAGLIFYEGISGQAPSGYNSILFCHNKKSTGLVSSYDGVSVVGAHEMKM